MITSISGSLSRPAHVTIQSVPILRPFTWVGRGAVDLVRCWPGNAAHGLLMVLIGWVLLVMLGNHPYFVSAAISGFLLGAPVMTTGIVELSRRRAARQQLGFDASLEALSRDGQSLFKFGAVLAAIAALWFLLSEVLLSSLFSIPAPSMAETYYRGFADAVNRDQLLLYVAIGAVLALVVFLLSVVTVPLIIDRHVGANQAMRVSLGVVTANPLAMLVWSALIVAIAIVGFATILLGMIVLIPLLGHATWHAYRDLIR